MNVVYALALLWFLFQPSVLAKVERPFVILHRQGEHACHTFRIPGITKTLAGTLLAVYDMRYRGRRDLQGHMDIGLSRSTNGGKTWETTRPIMDMGTHGDLPEDQNGCSDPNILLDTVTGEIIVSAVWTHGRPGTHQWNGKGSEPGLALHQTSQFMMVRSKDDGVTWSMPENWTARLKDPTWYLIAPAPGNGVTMADGTLIMPAAGRDAAGLHFSTLMWRKNRGKTWTVANQAARSDTTECAVAELSDGALMLNMRDNRNRKDTSENNGRAVSVTNDLGRTWTMHASDHGALPEPVCMASLISYEMPDGGTVLFFSNSLHKSKRRNMTVQMSMDDGVTWSKRISLDDTGGAYSSLVMVDDTTPGILYESSGADLVFQTVDLKEFGLGNGSLDSGNYSITQSWSQETDFDRPYFVRVPQSKAAERLPVFVFLHGNGGNAERSMNAFVRQHPTLAETHIMVFADGYAKSWNIVSERSRADDRRFIEAIVERLSEHDNVQPEAFTIMGSSNGAALVNQLAIECSLPNIRNYITAVSPLNSYQYDGKQFKAKGANNNYQTVAIPRKGIRLLNISGTEDKLVPYAGGPSRVIPAKDGKLAFVPAEESIFLWAKAMGYLGEKLTEPSKVLGNLEVFRYLNGDVVHYKVNQEGHGATRAINEDVLLEFIIESKGEGQ